ncbi:MAG: recombinase family protein [Alphaproteobacteria bacterium]|nr:MAG: recombinase family protein [Alphaproteobacteria bacterium]
MKAPTVKPVRCAIYTRVSTEQGLDQEFNSLDAQYEAAFAYIKSQAHAGWTPIRSRYDDGGYSGGSTDRPDLQKLLNDIHRRFKISQEKISLTDRVYLQPLSSVSVQNSLTAHAAEPNARRFATSIVQRR